MLRRVLFWIIVTLSFLVGAGAAPAQEKCTVRWYVGLGTGAGQEQIDAQNQVVEVFNVAQTETGCELVLQIDDNLTDAPLTTFYVGTAPTSEPADAASPLTVQFPQAGITATANGGSNLRGGPGTDYATVGATQAGQVFNVTAAVNAAGYTWLNLERGAWLRSDLATVSNPQALAALRYALRPPLINEVRYNDMQRQAPFPLPSGLLVQTQPDRTVAYDFNGVTVVQTGTAVFTQDNFSADQSARRFYFTNLQGKLQVVAPLSPAQVEAGRTIEIDFTEDGTPQGYAESFTQQEQEFTTAAYLFTCDSANLVNQALTNVTGAGYLWDEIPCATIGTYQNLHPGWYAVSQDLQTAVNSTTVTETVDVVDQPPQPVEPPAQDSGQTSDVLPIISDDQNDSVVCNNFQSVQPQAGRFWDIRGYEVVPATAGAGTIVTVTMAGGENIAGTRFLLAWTLKANENITNLVVYGLDIQGDTVTRSGRFVANNLEPGTENTATLIATNQVVFTLDPAVERFLLLSGVPDGQCDVAPNVSNVGELASWAARRVHWDILP